MMKTRYETVKNRVVNGRCTVNDLRTEIRKEFKDRIQKFRSEQVDARRYTLNKNAVSSMIKEGFSKLQASLLTDKEAVALLDADSVLKMLGEVQEELLHDELELEAEAHEEEVQRETSAIVENLLSTCSICERFVHEQLGSNIICQDCAITCFSNSNVQ